MQDELLDIVNEQDQVIGTMPRSQVYAEKKIASIRAAWLLIKNQDNQFWIPQRCSKKASNPDTLDGSTVGHVSSGETYEQAMIREVAEELNFDISHMSYTSIGKLTPTTGALSFIEIFELQVPCDFVIDYNTDDFSQFYWLSAQEIIQKFHEGQSIRKTLVSIMQTFYV